MPFSVKICLLASGLFLLAGMGAGWLKYAGMMRSPRHRAPAYIDIAHRAALLYSFAALVMAKLVEFSPFAPAVRLAAVAAPLAFFALTVAGYLRLGLQGREETQFSERNFITTWFMYALIAGEIGGVSLLVWGFVLTQFLK
jgi:hypothetical protein